MQPPRVSVEVVGCSPGPSAGSWWVSWLLHNQGTSALQLESAWIPHGRFRGPGRLPLWAAVDPGAAARIAAQVATDEAPGTTVENAFLIVRLQQAGQPWRVFSRMRIAFDAEAVPRPIVEELTTQAVGEGYHDQ